MQEVDFYLSLGRVYTHGLNEVTSSYLYGCCLWSLIINSSSINVIEIALNKI